MATVVGKTSDRIDQLLSNLLVGVEISGNGRLLVTSRDGTVFDAGSVDTGTSKRIPILHARLSQAHTRPIRIGFLGSSTTVGQGASFEDRRFVNKFISALQRAYPCGIDAWEPPVRSLSSYTFAPNLPGIHGGNGGFGGTTSADYCAPGHVLQLTTFKADVVVHTVGANDYRFQTPTPGEVEQNLIGVMAQLDVSLPDAIHIFLGTYPMPAAGSPLRGWNEYLSAIRAAAVSHPRGIFLDASDAFEIVGIPTTDTYGLIGDTIHPTDAGHALLAHEASRQLVLPPPPVILDPIGRDRFARKTLGNLETGQPWVQQAGTWAVNGQQLYPTVAGHVAFDSGFSDAEVSVILKYSSGAIAGPFAKSNDTATRMGFYLSPNFGPGSTPAGILYRGGTLLAVSATQELVNGREYHLRVVAKGAALHGYLDGKLIVSYTNSQAEADIHAAYTHHGVRANSTSGTPAFRNFSARPV